MKLDNAKLLLSDGHGVYIPKLFANNFDMAVWNVNLDDVKCVSIGPEPSNEWYWEAWQSILDTATTIHNGVKYYLYQDGDLWAVPEDDYTSDEECM